jgi:hypothetical protein
MERLTAGHTIIFRGVALTIRRDMLEALIETWWTTQPQQTPDRARADLARAEEIVAILFDEVPGLAELVGECEIEYHVIAGYSRNAVYLAELRGGQFRWTGPPFPSPQ